MGKDNLSSIVKKAKNGNDKALNTLFTETYNDVYYFALKTVKDETLAADITQETFVTIFQNLGTLKDPVAYPAWSRQITYRNCIQYLKKQNREVVVDENEDGNTVFDTIEEDKTEFIPQENLDKEDFKRTILKIVDELPQEQRTAVLLYYYDELSVKEIAQIQGVTEGTVKSRLNYARKAIKAAVEDYENKNNVKLHSVGALPILSWLFKTDAASSIMSPSTAGTVATGISTALKAGSSAASFASSGVKVAASLWPKIVAGVVASGIVIGGTVATANFIKKPNSSKPRDSKPTVSNSQSVQTGSEESKDNVTALSPGTWRGRGGISSGLNLSNENEFVLEIEKISETYIKGSLTVSIPNGYSYQRTFVGVGETPEVLYAGSIFYYITLNEEVEKFLSDLPGYTDLILRYDIETGDFHWHYIPYSGVMKKEKTEEKEENFFENKTDWSSYFSY